MTEVMIIIALSWVFHSLLPAGENSKATQKTAQVAPEVQRLKDLIKRLVWQDQQALVQQTGLDDRRLSWIKTYLLRPQINGSGLCLEMKKWRQEDLSIPWLKPTSIKNSSLLEEVTAMMEAKIASLKGI
ncbi:MAG: hypothetical protein HC851_19260 [Acaryochloris sp. RU_4_1]|nr:hypothetical protein [Acaryochloris sp. RU_4_1]